LLDIYIDADGCPVKEEVYRVARRHDLKVTLVTNSRMRIPPEDRIEQVVVEGGFDAADDWIVEHAAADDVVVTADIELAARALRTGALAIDPRGRVFTEESIGEALATRDLMSHLRDLGTITGGPPVFERKDRSRFLHRLDEIIQVVRRKR
jgi:hypothetical protein